MSKNRESGETNKARPGKIIKIVIAIFIALLIVFSVVSYAVTAHLMKKNFSRGEYPDPRFSAYYRYDHYAAEYPREEVSFKSGENTLKGWIYGMDNDKGLIVFAHGIGGGHENYMNFLIRLIDCGWRVFTYDATGSCESEGEGTIGLTQSALDLDNALTFAEGDDRLNSLPFYVLGHSWGGFASAAVLNFDHDVKACVTLSGYHVPIAELNETTDHIMGAASPLFYPFTWLYNKVQFGKYSGLSAVDGINNVDIPVLVVHADQDEVISYDSSSIISQKDRITNPNAEYYTFSDEERNGHNTYFNTPEYVEYKLEFIDPKVEELTEKYGEDVPDDVREEFYASIDKDIFNATNDELVELVDGFFEKAFVQ